MTKKALRSMMYVVFFEHIKAGMVRKGNYALQLNEKPRIKDYEDIKAIEIFLAKEGFVDPVVFEWKELGMRDLRVKN